jgi:hypothetical protein
MMLDNETMLHHHYTQNEQSTHWKLHLGVPTQTLTLELEPQRQCLQWKSMVLL